MASFCPVLLVNIIAKKHSKMALSRMFRASVFPFRLDKRLSSDHVAAKGRKKMDDYFINTTVQSILLKITGKDYEKIFRPKKERLSPPKYEFVTEKRLKELEAEASEKADSMLQMPPVMDIREPIEEELSYDPELQGFKDSSLVFIDTTPNVSDRERFITVREVDGTLRKANWDERFKMNQIFFPLPGRNLYTPVLFESPYLEKLMDEESFVYLLDRCCCQFEPDDPEFHRVTHAVFDRINENKMFDILRSTRYFGPMAFYYAWENKIEKLLIDMIEREKISDAADLVKLFYILNLEYEMQERENASDLEVVEAFVKSNSSPNKVDLELAIQTYVESQQKISDAENEVMSSSSS